MTIPSCRRLSSSSTRIYPNRGARVPELPDITVYIEALEKRVLKHRLENVRLASPFVVRTFEPPIAAVFGKKVRALRRMGKRIVFELEKQLFMVIHLMIAGRLR